MDVLREILAIVFVLALLLGALWLLRKRGALNLKLGIGTSAGGRLIESRGKLVLSAQHSLHWVRAGDRQVLLGIHPSGFTVIGDVGAEASARAHPIR
jgi:flagellar biogenesis protein FliO